MAKHGSSPNLRLKEQSTQRFHRVQAKVAGELGLGLRGVTADILVAALLRVCDTDEYLPALVAAVNEERTQRMKGDDT